MTTVVQKHRDHGGVARIQNLPAPASANEPARLADLNAAIEGLAPKDNVRVSTQGNISLASPGATIDTVTMAVNDRVLVRAQTAPAENGIYIWNGAAVAMTRAADGSTFDELESAIVPVDEGTDAGNTYRQTGVNGTLGTTAVNWIVFGSGVPAATETQAGKVELADATELEAGTDTTRAVSPGRLGAWSGRHRGASQVIGDGSATQFTLAHNWNTLNVLGQVRRNTAPYDDIDVDIDRVDANTIRATFLTAPTANQFVFMAVRVS